MQEWSADRSPLQHKEVTMTKSTFVGVDIAKDKFDVALLRKDKGPQLKVFNNNKAGHAAFVEWLKNKADDLKICLEATGHYSEGLAEYLHKKNIFVSVVNPYKIKQFAKLMLLRNKNDTVDSILIGQYAAKMLPEPFKPRTVEQKQLREYIQLSDTIKDQIIQLENKMSSMQIKAVKKIIESSIEQMNKKIKKIGECIDKLVAESEYFSKVIKRLTAIKGIGELSVHKILAYLPEVSQFHSAKALAAYIGLSPKQNESGKFKGKTHICKFGSAHLRKALYMPALSVKRHNQELQPFVMRLEKSGLKPKAIVCALMRKLSHIIYGMLKSDCEYDPNLV